MFRLSMAVAVAALIALPELGHAAPAQAKSGNAKSSNAESSVGNADSLEVSAARRRRYHQSRSSTRVTVRPAHRYGWRYHPPYGPHPSDLASNSHPYFVPGAPKFAPGFRHDGFGTGAYGFGYQ